MSDKYTYSELVFKLIEAQEKIIKLQDEVKRLSAPLLIANSIFPDKSLLINEKNK